MRRALPVLALAFWTSAASASWVDKFGREISFSFPGSAPIVLSKGNHTLADGIAAFDAVCLKTEFNRNEVEKAVGALNWGFSYRAETVSFKPPVDIGGWNAADATVRVGTGLFFNKHDQCNLAVMTSDVPTADAIVDGLAAVIGKAPDNAKKRYNKQGQPYPYFSPEWTVVDARGRTMTVYAQQSSTLPGTVHFAVVGK